MWKKESWNFFPWLIYWFQLVFSDMYLYLLIKSTKCATVTYLGTDFSVKPHKTTFYYKINAKNFSPPPPKKKLRWLLYRSGAVSHAHICILLGAFCIRRLRGNACLIEEWTWICTIQYALMITLYYSYVSKRIDAKFHFIISGQIKPNFYKCDVY